MIILQQSLVDLCDKAKDKWQKLDADVTVVTSGDNCMNINQAVHYIAHCLKLQKNVSYYTLYAIVLSGPTFTLAVQYIICVFLCSCVVFIFRMIAC